MTDLNFQSVHIDRAVALLGTQAALAKAIGFSQQYVSALLHSRLRCSAEAALKIETATAAKVTAHDLRPDLYRPLEQRAVA